MGEQHPSQARPTVLSPFLPEGRGDQQSFSSEGSSQESLGGDPGKRPVDMCTCLSFYPQLGLSVYQHTLRIKLQKKERMEGK